MIPSLHPPNPATSWTSPFCRGEQSHLLKLTFHSASLVNLDGEEADALQALYELANLPSMAALHTEGVRLPRIDIDSSNPNFDGYLVNVVNEDGSPGTLAGVPNKDRWVIDATHLVGGGATNSPAAQAMFHDLIIAQAHCALESNILVTTSRWLLDRRTVEGVREANPYLPSEAARIVGLFLRRRDDYTYMASTRSKSALNQWLFHWVLTRHRLPSMWRYFSACHYAADIRGDDTFGLAQSIMNRCVRVIQARDAIGERFYQARPRETLDDVMYHFDYLPILSSGVLDSQARIAHRAYQINKPQERWSSFNNPDFKRALKRSGARGLYDLVTSKEFEALATLTYRLRNTIHGAGLEESLRHDSNHWGDAGYVHLSQDDGKAIWDAVRPPRTKEEWGLVWESYSLLRPPHTEAEQVEQYLVEPYTYSVSLVQETLKIIDNIAAATDVERLFPTGHPIPTLTEGPPEKYPFSLEIRERLAILG